MLGDRVCVPDTAEAGTYLRFYKLDTRPRGSANGEHSVSDDFEMRSRRQRRQGCWCIVRKLSAYDMEVIAACDRLQSGTLRPTCVTLTR